MYNEELKKRFITDVKQSEGYRYQCEKLFDVSEKFEKEYDNDICSMTPEQLEEMLNSVTGIRSTTSALRIGIVKRYVKWCVFNNIEGAINNISDIKLDNLVKIDKMKSEMVSSPQQLQEFLDAVFRPVDEKTVENTYRCFYWLAFSGVLETDFMMVTSKDIDLESMIINFEDREYIIYEESVPVLKDCMETTEFAYYHPNYSAPTYKQRVDGDNIVRGMKKRGSIASDIQQRRKSMVAEISKRVKKARDSGFTDLKLSYKNTWLSGVFYRIYQGELNGVDPDFSWVYDMHMKKRGWKEWKKLTGTQESRANMVIRSYQKDYEQWKLTF